MPDPAPVPAEPWWRGAAIYQIYPRSFADSDGDGVGDLPGIIAHLDHVATLGVDAVWLSPFFRSPMADFGYDVSDHCDVDPLFGTLADFDALVARAHALGLKVLIDQVYAHTSDAHPWFAESRASRTNARADWYVWADPRPDGTAPSNWLSTFGGPTWTWDARRGQYYMHNFLSAQPQLAGHAPPVQAAQLAVAEFWLARGVDGFRLDAINFMIADRALTDNPPVPAGGKPRTRPFDFQQHVHNQNQPEVAGFLEQLRALTDRHGGRFTVAEIGGDDTLPLMRAYTAPGRLDSAYAFDFLDAKALTPALVRDTLRPWIDDGAPGWASWAFENHDVPRAISRWAPAGGPDDAYARMTLLLLACLRGNVFVYNGQELGLDQADIAFDQLRDPEAIVNWPSTLGRDGARTPMPWRADAPGLGFTAGTPWLPFGANHAARAVDRQADDPGSMLAFTRAALALRRAHPALRLGAMRFIAADAALLVFDRTHGAERVLCAFNLGAEPLAWTPPGTPPGAPGWRPLLGSTGAGDGDGVLAPYSGIVLAAREAG